MTAYEASDSLRMLASDSIRMQRLLASDSIRMRRHTYASLSERQLSDRLRSERQITDASAVGCLFAESRRAPLVYEALSY